MQIGSIRYVVLNKKTGKPTMWTSFSSAKLAQQFARPGDEVREAEVKSCSGPFSDRLEIRPRKNDVETTEKRA